MSKLCLPVAARSSNTAKIISLFSLLPLISACGLSPYDLDRESDRNAMIASIKSSLNGGNCSGALEKSLPLFESKYSTNEVRMLHASSYGCKAGIKLLPLLTQLTQGDFSASVTGNPLTNPLIMKMFNTLARMFPSNAATDANLQSLWLMQDVLQSVVEPGSVISTFDQNVINAYNTGSLLYRDRTDDSNTLLMFSSMALLGTMLNRYGNPNTGSGYTQGKNFASTWSNELAIKNDSTESACSLASSILNMQDGLSVMSVVSSGSLSTILSLINLGLDELIQAGKQRCENGATNKYSDGNSGVTYGSTRCNSAVQRLRYRNACYETDKDRDPVIAYAFGVLLAVDGSWSN
jgi:hypothetical protein